MGEQYVWRIEPSFTYGEIIILVSGIIPIYFFYPDVMKLIFNVWWLLGLALVLILLYVIADYRRSRHLIVTYSGIEIAGYEGKIGYKGEPFGIGSPGFPIANPYSKLFINWDRIKQIKFDRRPVGKSESDWFEIATTDDKHYIQGIEDYLDQFIDAIKRTGHEKLIDISAL